MTEEQKLRERLLMAALSRFGPPYDMAWAEECFDYVMSGKVSKESARAYEGRQ